METEMKVRKVNHSSHWGTGKTILFWIGCFFLFVTFGAFGKGDFGVGVIILVTALSMIIGALNIKNKNQWND